MPAGAAITYVSTASNSPGQTLSLALSKPSTTQANDVMLAQVAARGGSAITITAPLGWTLINRTNNSTTLAQAVYYRVATASELGSYSWGLGSTAVYAAGGITVYRGVDTTNPVNVWSNRTNGSFGSVTADGVTTTVAGDMLVGVFANADGRSNFTWPASMPNERYDTQSGSGQDNAAAISVADDGAAQTTPGSTGDIAATTTKSVVSVAHLIALKPASGTTTLATGTDPTAATIAPGAAVTDVNVFTLQTSSGTEAITSVTVNLSTNSGVGRLSITDSTGTELGFTTSPATGSNTITVAGMSATTTLTTFKVRVTPLSHAAMPDPSSGAAYAITAPVTTWTGPNTHTGSDTNPNALTIDNLSPSNVSAASGTPGNGQVVLSWTNPGDADLSSVVVLRNTVAVTDTPAEGATYSVGNTIGSSTVSCVVATATCTDTGLSNGTAYYYKLFAKDSNGNYATGVRIGPFTPVVVVAVSSFNACSNSDACPTSTARLYTRIANQPFAVYLAALKTDGTVATTFSGSVAVSLLGRIVAGGPVGGDNCPTGAVDLTQALGTLAFTSGKRTQTGVTVDNAYRDVRVKFVCDATNCPPSGKTVCSSDNFSVRPSAFMVSSSANADATGTSTIATPVVKTGATFTLTATALASYNGTPLVDPSKLAAHTGAIQYGSLDGSFGAAAAGTGVATGNFTYSEVGYFNFAAQGLYDVAFATDSDTSGTDCTDDFNNTYTATDPTSRVGCKFGNTATTDYFGRFVPDHFAVTAGSFIDRADINTGGSEALCASTFTYMGEDFKTAFTLTAQNSANATTQNYTGGHAKFGLTTWSNYAFTASSGTLQQGTAAPSGAWGSTSGTYGTAAVTATHKVTRPALPTAPHTAFSVSAQPTYTDSTATIALAASTATHAGTSEQRFGRLRLSNAYGSERLALPMAWETQYWNGQGFIRNIQDSCTSLSATNIVLGNYLAPPGALAPLLSAANLSTVTVGALSDGVGKLTLAPTVSATGSVDLVVNLGSAGTPSNCRSLLNGTSTSAVMPYLSGQWCGAANDRDPTARATFGIYKSPLIYRRENY